MNHINKLCTEIRDFLTMISKDEPLSVDLRSSLAIKTYGNQTYCLVENELTKYNEIISNILRYSNYNARFCRNFIESKLDNLISEVITDETRIKELVQNLFDILDESQFANSVYLPINGIKSTISPLQLGPYIFIQNPENTIEQDLLSQIESLFPSSKTGVASQIKMNIMEEYSGKFVLELAVDADSSKAVELAILKGNIILNILKLYLPCHILVNNLIDCAIGGRPLNYVDKWLIIDRKNNSLHFSSSMRGSILPLELNETNVELIRQGKIEKILSLVGSHKKNKFEEALLRAIDWYIDAGSKVRKSDKLLSLAICLECVMTAKGSGAIKDSITENVAVLLGGNLVDRKNTKAALNKLFAERNKIAHGSSLNEAEENLLKYFELVRGVILELVDFIGEVDSLEDIHSKFEDQRLSPKNIE